MFKIDSTGATASNTFTEGDPGVGTPATVVSAEWLNAVQGELVDLVVGLGGEPDKGTSDQIKTLLLSLLNTRHVLHVSVFEANGTFIVPEGVTKIWVSATAGGGGGGGGHTSNYFGGGAASGQSIIRKEFDVVPGTEIDIVIGGGGPGGAVGLAGTDGGDTVIGDLITLLGGDGGNPGTASGNGNGGDGIAIIEY